MSMRRGNARRVVSAAPASSSPIPTSGLVLWVRSDVVVGSPVSQWTDQSGNGNHLVAAGAARPAIVASDAAFGNKPSLTWDGVATTMATTVPVTLGALTYILVEKCTTGVGYFAVFKDDATDYFYTSTTFSSFITRTGSCTANLGANWGQNASARTLVRTFDGTAAGHTIRANGADLGATPAGSDPGTGTLTQTLFLGSSQVPGTFLTGSIAEFIVYNRAVVGAEITAIESYLRTRYGHY